MAEPQLLFENREKFAGKVKRSKGKVIVLVHPLYSLAWKDRKYRRALEGVMKKATAPIIVLEEAEKVAKTHAELKNAKPVYYVETVPNWVTPMQSWAALHTALRNARVKTILLGGMNAKHAEPDDAIFRLDRETAIRAYERSQRRPAYLPITARCVGETYFRLIQGNHGKIRLMPELLSPDKPEY